MWDIYSVLPACCKQMYLDESVDYQTLKEKF